MLGLDLLRALAISMVVVSHASGFLALWLGAQNSPLIARAGFFGVELFFVLSGFLIGRLLIRMLDTGPSARAWLVFMQRRWMRTLPLYYFWLAVLAIFWRPYFWLPGSAALWRDLPWFLTLTQNLGWRMVDDWFGVSWSLTIEEWFYLSFSALLVAGAAIAGRKIAFLAALLLFLAAPPLLREAMPAGTDWDDVISKVVPLRLDAIAFGVVLAWVDQKHPVWLRDPGWLLAAGALAVGAIWLGVWPFGDHARRVLVFDATSAGYALCLPAATRLRAIWPPVDAALRAISTQSYAIYLMHLSVLEIINFYRHAWGLPPVTALALALGLVWILSYLSWRLVERPILARRPVQPGRGNTVPRVLAA